MSILIQLNLQKKQKLYISINSGKMPPSKIELLTQEEEYIIRDWLESEKKRK
jgi:uncharacterized membrane protein